MPPLASALLEPGIVNYLSLLYSFPLAPSFSVSQGFLSTTLVTFVFFLFCVLYTSLHLIRDANNIPGPQPAYNQKNPSPQESHSDNRYKFAFFPSDVAPLSKNFLESFE